MLSFNFEVDIDIVSTYSKKNQNAMETQEQKELIRKHPNYRLIFMNEAELREELKDWTREQLISWLCWNDPNGLYRDEDGMAEVGRIMTYEEGVEYIMRQVGDGG
ncbi:MAG TPA: hypothetical protein DEP18_03475 [Flavobacteriales bacterium]|nr:hypothetical protein [Flavobacteriales bacterium]